MSNRDPYSDSRSTTRRSVFTGTAHTSLLQRSVDDPSQFSGAERIAQTIKCTQSYCFQIVIPLSEPREDHYRNVASHTTRNS